MSNHNPQQSDFSNYVKDDAFVSREVVQAICNNLEMTLSERTSTE